MARTMRAVEITKPGTPFKLVERPIPDAGRGQVRIAVDACGICPSDAFVKEGHFPGVVYPRIPGHEVIGRIDAVGEAVTAWKSGQRVGVGWHGWHCGVCEACRSGDFLPCQNELISGFSFDGGYAEYMMAPQEALAAVPDALDSVAGAPLLCAGVTTFNSLRNSGARAGDLVAVQAIGGLGHLGIQYSRKLGFRTVALSRGGDKRALALELGAHAYIATEAGDPAAALQKLGGPPTTPATPPAAHLTRPPPAAAAPVPLPAPTATTAKMPGRAVSKRWGTRASGQPAAARSPAWRSVPVLTNPFSSSGTQPCSQAVLGAAPIIRKRCWMSRVSLSPLAWLRQRTRSRRSREPSSAPACRRACPVTWANPSMVGIR